MKKIVCRVALSALSLLSGIVHAQSWLQKPVTLSVQRQPLGVVLKELETRSGASFSYNSSAIPTDSLVSLFVNAATLNAVLGKLLGDNYEYHERGRHVVIRPATDGATYSVTGYVFDRETGERVLYASVYEPRQLASAVTDERGYFRLKLKDEVSVAALSIRHMSYADTAISLRPGRDAELTISIAPRPNELDSIIVVPRNAFERFLARLFISPRLRMQDLNLTGFVAEQPFQLSLVPGLGTHGKLSGQVVDKVSLNVLGGYSAGVRGVQLGSLFNIVRDDVSGAQAAGLFSLVGGNATGAQAAGLYNGTLGSVRGAQASGIASRAGGSVHGAQASGLYSEAVDSLHGVQASGVANLARRRMRGVQAAGVANIALDTMRGVQISGVVNIAKRSEGFQLGLINIADTSAGYTLGLINVVRHGGVHELSFSTNEAIAFNASVRTGTPKLYTILTAGTTPGTGRLYAFGAGIGRKVALGKHFSFAPELTTQHLYLGTWDEGPNLLNRADLRFSWKITRGVQLIAGPSVSVYYTKQRSAVEGYRFDIPGYKTYELGGETRGWIGGVVGVSFF